MTLSDPKPQFQGHGIVLRQTSRNAKRCIRFTPCLVLGCGFWKLHMQHDMVGSKVNDLGCP